MAITLVSTATIATQVANGTSAGVNMTGANFLVAHVNVFGYTPLPSKFSDSSNNTWYTLSEFIGNTHVFPGLFFAINPTVTSTQTFTFTGTTSDFKAITIAGFSGVDTHAPIDFDVTAQGVSTSAPTAGACAPAQNNCLILSAMSYANSTLSAVGGVPSGFTSMGTIAGPTSQGNGFAYLVEGTTSSVNPAWTFTGATSQWAQLNVVVLPPQTNGILQASTFVPSVNKNTAVSTGLNTTNANFIYLEVGDGGAGTNTTVVSDSLANTYTAITTFTFGANRVSTWYSANPIVSSTHTFTASNSNAGPIMSVMAFNGMSTTPFDQVVGTSLNIPGTLTPTNNGEILISAVIGFGTAVGTVTNSGFIVNGSVGSNTNVIGGAVAYKLAATKKATSVQWNSDAAARVSNLAAFIVSANITTNQTVTGKARIQITSTQTITGKARIQLVTLQTLLGKARIGTSVLQTLLGKARIQATTSQTLLGKARLTNTTNQTVTGKARIRQTVSQTLTGIARIVGSSNQTLTGKANIYSIVNKTLTGKAAIGQTTTQLLTGIARLGRVVNQTITGVARIFRQSHTDPNRTFHVMADDRHPKILAEATEFDVLKDERVYKVLE